MIPRELVMKSLTPVADFLGKNYPCKCPNHPESDCPGEIYEAEEVVRIVLEAVAMDILAEGWRRGASDMDEPGYYSEADLQKMNPFLKETA